MSFYEHLTEDENFKQYEKEVFRLYRDFVDTYLNKGDEFTKGKMVATKEIILVGIDKVKDKERRVKLKERIKKLITGIEYEASLND